MKWFFVILIPLIVFIGHNNVFAQPKTLSDTSFQVPSWANQYDSGGLKDGYWIEAYPQGCYPPTVRWELYYQHGKRQGIFKCYTVSINGQLSLFVFGEYDSDCPIGVWYMIDTYGQIMGIDYGFQENKDFFTLSDLDSPPNYFCKSKKYYRNGVVESEGILLYNNWEDAEIDSWPYGEWLFYDESGALKGNIVFQ